MPISLGSIIPLYNLTNQGFFIAQMFSGVLSWDLRGVRTCWYVMSIYLYIHDSTINDTPFFQYPKINNMYVLL